MSFVAGWMVSGSPKEPDGALTRIDFRNSNGKPIFRQGIDRLPKWPLLSGPLDPEHRIGTLRLSADSIRLSTLNVSVRGSAAATRTYDGHCLGPRSGCSAKKPGTHPRRTAPPE